MTLPQKSKRKTKKVKGGTEGENPKTHKKKVVLLVLSTIFGYSGADRFYTGQIGLGLLKLFTLGGIGVWYFVDMLIVLINSLTKSKEGIFGFSDFNDDDDINISYALGWSIILAPILVAIIHNLTNRNEQS
jgi:TM2 domain-containing membrane protein YozV